MVGTLTFSDVVEPMGAPIVAPRAVVVFGGAALEVFVPFLPFVVFVVFDGDPNINLAFFPTLEPGIKLEGSDIKVPLNVPEAHLPQKLTFWSLTFAFRSPEILSASYEALSSKSQFIP